MSLKHAILGFLSYQSMTGYDLKKAFDQSVRHFWPADQSQIYRTLKQLHDEELISQDIFPREDRPDMKVYAITGPGRRELREWLSTPLPAADTREPFLVQLYFAFLLEDEQVALLLKTEIAQIDELLQTYAAIYDTAAGQNREPADARPVFYSMLTLEFGIKANRWYRDWLSAVLERVEAGDTAVLSFDELRRSSPRAPHLSSETEKSA